LSALCYSIVNQATAFDPTRDKLLYAVGYGHLDDQWNWTIQETINNLSPIVAPEFAFFTNANYTNYTFSFEGALRYQFIKEYYPADFLSLSNYIRQGRWHVAGSMITPSDVNIPSPRPSSATRFTPIIIGPRLLAEARGPAVADAFGFGYALPTIAAHCGVKGFSSMRAGPGTGISLRSRTSVVGSGRTVNRYCGRESGGLFRTGNR